MTSGVKGIRAVKVDSYQEASILSGLLEQPLLFLRTKSYTSHVAETKSAQLLHTVSFCENFETGFDHQVSKLICCIQKSDRSIVLDLLRPTLLVKEHYL